MPTLNDGTNKWDTGSNPIVLTQQNNTVIKLQTNTQYVTKNIELTVNAQTASPVFDGGAVSGAAAAAYTNATTTSTNSSGVVVTASATASRAAVLYNGAVDGWVNKADNTTASAAVTNQALTSETKYIKGVNIINEKNFDITVPNGALTVTFNFAVDAEGNVLVT